MKKEQWILFLGTYPPRECGIATFTRDLVNAVDNKFSGNMIAKVCSMNGSSTVYNYPERVILQIEDSNIEEYLEVAKKINSMEQIKLINIQHEFGIFGGEYGNYLIPFLEILEKPVVITFHTVLPRPNGRLLKVVQSIARKASSLVVMTPKAVEILEEFYGITENVVVIPHGIPTVPFLPNTPEKKLLGYDNKIILSSFGLMSSGKGYEYVIESLPSIVEYYPELLYLFLG